MSSRKPKSKLWSAWGDWYWSQTYSRHYSQRQDTQGEIETRWGPRYDSGVVSEYDEKYDGDDDGDTGYSPGTSSPSACKTSEPSGQDERPSEEFQHADSVSGGTGNDRRPSKSYRQKREDDGAQGQNKRHPREHERGPDMQHSAGVSTHADDRVRKETSGSRHSRVGHSTRSEEPAQDECGASGEVHGGDLGYNTGLWAFGGFGRDPPSSQGNSDPPENYYNGYGHPDTGEGYYHDYDYHDEQPNLGFQFQGSGYDGGSQWQNDPFVPPEGDSDEYPGSSPRGYKIASRGVDERDVGAPSHYPPLGHNIMSGGNHEQDAQTPRHSCGNYESGDEEQDISLQDSKKKSRRKGKAPARDRSPPYNQGHPGSYSGHDSNVYYRGDDGKFYKGVGKSSRRDKNVYYRGDDGKLHEGIGKNRGNQGKGGQNDREAKIGGYK